MNGNAVATNKPMSQLVVQFHAGPSGHTCRDTECVSVPDVADTCYSMHALHDAKTGVEFAVVNILNAAAVQLCNTCEVSVTQSCYLVHNKPLVPGVCYATQVEGQYLNVATAETSTCSAVSVVQQPSFFVLFASQPSAFVNGVYAAVCVLALLSLIAVFRHYRFES